MNEMQELLEGLRWTFAKSMPKNPHFYIVRHETCGNEDYEKIFNYIYENHKIVWHWHKPYKAVDIGKYRYWIMTDDITESRIINRRELKPGENL